METTATVRVRMDATVRVADEVWVALALLHCEYPSRISFTAGEIRQRVEKEGIAPELRPGVATHIGQHCVANTPPKSGTYRMLLRLPDGSYRLYRPGDECHPRRKGKTTPHRSELPEPYHYLLDWYEREYRSNSGDRLIDPVLAMAGVGKDLWMEEGGDAFINRLREEWVGVETSATQPDGKAKAALDPDRVWVRIIDHQGESFETVRGLPLTYEVEGAGIWFFRDGRRIDKKLWRGDVEKAIERCPLRKTTDIKDVMDPAYLFALLMDKRIRQNDW